MSTVLSGTINIEGLAVSLAKTLTLGVSMIRTFELKAAGVREFTFDTLDGTVLKFFFIKAVQASDPTQQKEIQYSNLDADGADPPNGTGWKEINSLEISYAERALSSGNNSFYLYNAGNEALQVTVAAALEGA